MNPVVIVAYKGRNIPEVVRFTITINACCNLVDNFCNSVSLLGGSRQNNSLVGFWRVTIGKTQLDPLRPAPCKCLAVSAGFTFFNGGA